jgi:hypothetical protein
MHRLWQPERLAILDFLDVAEMYYSFTQYAKVAADS